MCSIAHTAPLLTVKLNLLLRSRAPALRVTPQDHKSAQKPNVFAIHLRLVRFVAFTACNLFVTSSLTHRFDKKLLCVMRNIA